MSTGDLHDDLAALAGLSLSDLRKRWAEVSDKPLPKVRATLLRLALAFEMQAKVYGGLSRRTEQRLAWMAGRAASGPGGAGGAGGVSGSDAMPAPGTRLVREWDGVLHTVLIDEEGEIHWNGRTWRSLSEVARAITGTRWSGPVFFGLRQRKDAA